MSWSRVEAIEAKHEEQQIREQPRLMEGKAKKQDVLAYFNGRKEKEIVIDPAKVRQGKTHPVKPLPMTMASKA